MVLLQFALCGGEEAEKAGVRDEEKPEKQRKESSFCRLNLGEEVLLLQQKSPSGIMFLHAVVHSGSCVSISSVHGHSCGSLSQALLAGFEELASRLAAGLNIKG